MLGSLRLRLGTWYARFHFRRANEPIVHFTQAVSKSRRVIVLLPESANDVPSTESVLRFFGERFQTSKVVLVVKKELVPRVPEHQGFNLFTYGPEELNAWFVPRAELLQKMKKGTFDLALDLNQGFALPSSFLCRASQAPLRIGFVKPYADDFYNFQIQTDQSKDPSQAYSTLLKCIEMF
jgi:ADP-heptose:LPS heptosyltransferase